MESKEWISITEAARRYDVNRSTIYRWSKKGILPIYKLPSGASRIKVKDLEKLQEQAKPLHGGREKKKDK